MFLTGVCLSFTCDSMRLHILNQNPSSGVCPPQGPHVETRGVHLPLLLMLTLITWSRSRLTSPLTPGIPRRQSRGKAGQGARPLHGLQGPLTDGLCLGRTETPQSSWSCPLPRARAQLLEDADAPSEPVGAGGGGGRLASVCAATLPNINPHTGCPAIHSFLEQTSPHVWMLRPGRGGERTSGRREAGGPSPQPPTQGISCMGTSHPAILPPPVQGAPQSVFSESSAPLG